MHRILIICSIALFAGMMSTLQCHGRTALSALRLSELEQRLDDIDSELGQLAGYTLRGGTGALGMRTRAHASPDVTEWIRIELGEEVLVDQIVLQPALWRNSRTGLVAEGFPPAFRVIAGNDHSQQVVATRTPADELLPRIAPLAVDFPPVMASWIEINVSPLSAMISGKRYLLQLAEIMVFSGLENVALHKPVQASSRGGASSGPVFLTDGHGPYLMDAAQGARSQTQLIHVEIPQPPPTLTIDLKAAYPVNQINLHTADVALSIPMLRLSTWAVPRHVRITGASDPDFENEIILCEYRQQSIYDNGPIMMRRFPQTECRYIRVYILDPLPVVSVQDDPTAIAFTEIEILSDGRNIARNAPVTASPGLSTRSDALTRITDGLNYYGTILPIRDWMNQLARRHDLEAERPLVMAELNARYAHQKTILHRVAWLAALLAAGTVIIILIEQIIRQRAGFRIRERIAANLHDELGANLHAIGLLGDLAKEEIDTIETNDQLAELVDIVGEIRSVTEKTGAAARYCTHMLETPGLYEDLGKEMRQTARHLLADLEHDFTIENKVSLAGLKRRTRMDLALFYKECLTNIIRHSGATRVSSRIRARQHELLLMVTDNGCGIDGEIPASLKRRARFLGAKLLTEPADGGGTVITLTYKSRKLNSETKRAYHAE
ncbi:hypothetical protein P4B35_12135 [Pontiellaceae bacterium B12227]|nr:hypothetical protein [Pontiellaceae bacterium B12227]